MQSMGPPAGGVPPIVGASGPRPVTAQGGSVVGAGVPRGVPRTPQLAARGPVGGPGGAFQPPRGVSQPPQPGMAVSGPRPPAPSGSAGTPLARGPAMARGPIAPSPLPAPRGNIPPPSSGFAPPGSAMPMARGPASGIPQAQQSALPRGPAPTQQSLNPLARGPSPLSGPLAAQNPVFGQAAQNPAQGLPQQVASGFMPSSPGFGPASQAQGIAPAPVNAGLRPSSPLSLGNPAIAPPQVGAGQVPRPFMTPQQQPVIGRGPMPPGPGQFRPPSPGGPMGPPPPVRGPIQQSGVAGAPARGPPGINAQQTLQPRPASPGPVRPPFAVGQIGSHAAPTTASQPASTGFMGRGPGQPPMTPGPVRPLQYPPSIAQTPTARPPPGVGLRPMSPSMIPPRGAPAPVGGAQFLTQARGVLPSSGLIGAPMGAPRGPLPAAVPGMGQQQFQQPLPGVVPPHGSVQGSANPAQHPQPAAPPRPPQVGRAMRPSLPNLLVVPDEQLAQFPSTASDPQSGLAVPFPSPNFDYICVDTGSASCRLLRPTSRFVPSSSSICDELKFPLGILATPFAEPVPLSEWLHNTGPVRCSRCKGYLCVFSRFTNDYSRFECALCGYENDTPAPYRTYAMSGTATELKYGAVEYIVPESLFGTSSITKGTAVYNNILFVVDASKPAQMSGAFSMALKAILNMCRSGVFKTETTMYQDGQAQQQPEPVGGTRVGLITYDEDCVYFYEVNEATNKHRIYISGDFDDGFSPLPPDSVLIHTGKLNLIEEMISFVSLTVTSGTEKGMTKENIGGSALQSAYSCLNSDGGRIVFLTTQLCNKGAGKLADREQPALIGADREQMLYVADKDEKFYNELSLKCMQSSITVDVFVLGADYVDAAALVQMPSTTGGHFERIPHFDASNALHRQNLELLFHRACTRTKGIGSMMKMRTSSGLRVARYMGHGYPDESSFRVASVCSDFCIGVELEHDGTKLEDSRARAVVQLAILFVDVNSGTHRLRVLSAALQAKESAATLINSLDPFAVGLLLAKQASLELAEHPVNKVREGLARRLVDWARVLSKLPPRKPFIQQQEPFDIVFLCVNSILKSKGLMLNKPLDGRTREAFARADARILSRFDYLYMTPEAFALSAYPILVELNGTADPQQPTATRIPPSSEFLKPDNLFVQWDGSETVTVFIGAKTNPMILEQCFGLVPAPGIKSGFVSDRKTPISSLLFSLVSNAIGRFAEKSGVFAGTAPGGVLAVQIANGAAAEFFAENRGFLERLVEDKIYAEQSYPSLVNHVYQVMESNK